MHPWFKMCDSMTNRPYDSKKQAAAHRALANMRAFSSKNKLKQSALGFLVKHFLSMGEAIELQ